MCIFVKLNQKSPLNNTAGRLLIHITNECRNAGPQKKHYYKRRPGA